MLIVPELAQSADNWNCLSAPYVSSGTINTFKKHVSAELEPETMN